MKRAILIFLTISLAATWAAPLTAQRAEALLLSEALQLMQRGRYDRAREVLQSAPETDPHALRLLLELTQREGRQAESDVSARRLLDLYHSGQLRASGEIAQAAYAAWQMDLWQDANQLFLEASKVEPPSLSLFVDWGTLYLEKYNPAEAESIFLDGIKVDQSSSGNSRWGLEAAYVGLAQALGDQFKPGASQALDRALELNPHSLEAFVLKASLALEETDWETAEKWIDKGLQINRHYLPLLELKAVLEYFQSDTAAFEETRQRVLQINAQNGDLFERLGNLAVSKRRLQEAVNFYQEAIQRNPRQWSAQASLGINLLRLGKEDEGKQILEQVYARDPFNIWTVNTLRLLDSFDRFEQFETEHFRVKLHQKEAEALRPYVEELLEKSLAALEEKYQHQVAGKYIFEMYPDHEDFAVRTLGLPGLGALGATFGRIIAMDSPSARREGEFHWGSTLWHEMAHLVTLSLSQHKVPRWFTEGISMMEERQAAEGWGEYLAVSFVSAYEKNELLPLSDLNSGFEKPKSPRQLSISYYQAGWICEFLASRYGFDKIRAMLVAFGQGMATEEVFEKVLGASVDEVDRQFREEMERILKPLVPHLRASQDSPLAKMLQPEGKEEPAGDLEELKRAWQANPENYFLNLQLGSQFRAAGRNQEAIPYLEKALEIFPTYAGKESPYDLLSQIYGETGQQDKVLEIRHRWWKIAPRFVENAYALSDLLSERSQHQEAAAFLEETMYVNPLHPEAHLKLGDLLQQTGESEKAVREFKVLLELDPVDAAEVHFKLAQALLQSGNREEARRHVLLSLEIAPSYAEAQKLLLKLVQK